jgi:hypothetical protein
VKPRGSVDSKASYVRFFRPITSADSKKLSAAELSGDWTKKEEREPLGSAQGKQAPALHMELSTRLIIAWSKEKSIGKERASGED